MRITHFLFVALAFAVACQNQSTTSQANTAAKDSSLTINAAQFKQSSNPNAKPQDSVMLQAGEWLSFDMDIPTPGRYRISIKGATDSGQVWVEDYINNKDNRTFDITGHLSFNNKGSGSLASADGAPLDSGLHPIKVHALNDMVHLHHLSFELMQKNELTPDTLIQNTKGDGEWELVWSDEFNGSGLPDTSKWAYNVGDWGWGNKELQYYTNKRTKNARQENGALIIEAHKNDEKYPWSSARLTTQGRTAFLYGKIVFKAKVPTGRGNWAAGWLLGDEYRDELSWPYCGEIDVLECVGYEINDTTGNGFNHASCHTPKYYFKKGNQITGTIAMENMDSTWHTYSIEWYPDVIHASVDGEQYFTYDKNKDKLEWPFFKPQNIIVNLAVGGGWGGAQGVDPKWDTHTYMLDYVRVYQRKK